jgi:hypothetical protein
MGDIGNVNNVGNDWTEDIDQVLGNIRINCIILSKAHKERYFALKDTLKWYRLPVIILNGANSIIAVGLQPYATQGTISLTTSLIALSCGIIGSIELFFGIQKRLENDMISQRDYYLLGIDIYKTLNLQKKNRPVPAKDFLEKSYNIYTKLIESSATLAKVKGDKLIEIKVIKENDNSEDIVISPVPKRGSVQLSSNNDRELSITDD